MHGVGPAMGGPGYTWDNANPYARDVFEPNRRIDYILVGDPKARGAGHVVDAVLRATTQ